MASTSAMVRPPPGRSSATRPPPPPPKANKPPPPNRKAPPPPPPPKRPPPPSNSRPKRPAEEPKAAVSNKAKRTSHQSSHVRVPAALRDVTVFDKKKEVGKGTYGTVFVAQDRATKEVVALKHVNTKQEENGFPVTALREVKILKALSSDNIVKLKEMVTSKERSEGAGSVPKNVYMVFEFFEYDLFGILETPEIRFTIDHIKSWSRQLLLGIHYSHKNKVIHRDLKPSNLLVNLRGELKIADWGLARSWNSEMKELTNPVITLWYRPPELLLARGRVGYTSKIDMWSVGCIIAEMFRRSGFFRGKSEELQLDVIFRTCGHPSEADWPDLKSKYNLWPKFKPKEQHKVFPSRLEVALTTGVSNPKWMTPTAVQLLTKLLQMNPQHRWSAQEACIADFFFEEPVVKEARELSMDFNIRSVHEMSVKANYSRK